MMKKIDEPQKVMESDFEGRRRELFAKMTTEELDFLWEVDDWESSLFAYRIFERVGGLWFLGYLREQAAKRPR